MIISRNLDMNYNQNTGILNINAIIDFEWDKTLSIQLFKKSVQYVEQNLDTIIYSDNHKAKNESSNPQTLTTLLDKDCKTISEETLQNNVLVKSEIFKIIRYSSHNHRSQELEDRLTFENDFNIRVIDRKDCEDVILFVGEYLYNVYGVIEMFDRDKCESIISDVTRKYKHRKYQINKNLLNLDLEQLRREQIAKNILQNAINSTYE